LLRLGWAIKRQRGSHRVLSRAGWEDFVFSFHDNEELGPHAGSNRKKDGSYTRRPLTLANKRPQRTVGSADASALGRCAPGPLGGRGRSSHLAISFLSASALFCLLASAKPVPVQVEEKVPRK
jgi:predicted RNA binding protein YcfA (HicA-like mRNA interferase family)